MRGFFSQRTKVEKQTKEKIDKKETRKKDVIKWFAEINNNLDI